MLIQQLISSAGICGGNSDLLVTCRGQASFRSCFEPSHKRMKEKEKSKRRKLA